MTDKIPNCINNASAVYICIDLKCFESNPFICSACDQHKCDLIHKKCEKKQWAQYKMKLKLKNQLYKQELEIFCKQLEQMILISIKTLQNQHDYFVKWKSQTLKNIEQIQLINSINNNLENQWCGKHVGSILNQIEKKIRQEKSIQIKLKYDQKKIYHKVEELEKTIRKEYSNWHQQLPFGFKYLIRRASLNINQGNIMKIKEQFLGNVVKKIEGIDHKIQNLELKCMKTLIQGVFANLFLESNKIMNQEQQFIKLQKLFFLNKLRLYIFIYLTEY